MQGRPNLAPDLLSILLGALLGLATNFATSDDATTFSPAVKLVIQQWSAPAAGALVTVLLVTRMWQHLSETYWEKRRTLRSQECPYPGLEAFSEDDAGSFFGRDRDIRRLMERVQDQTAPGPRCVPVIGPSGSGKSSLVRAGLIPRLASRRGRWVVLPYVTPGANPLRALANALISCGLEGTVTDVVQKLEADHGYLRDAAEELRSQFKYRSQQMLIVIDQAEELTTSNTDTQENHYLKMLHALLADCTWACVVVIFRSEFLTHFLAGPHADLFEDPLTVGVLPPSALHEIIERPAKLAEVTFDPPDLVNRMVSDTRGGEALPLLAWTLYDLWERKGTRGAITQADYEASGGVAGALSARANSVIDELVRAGFTEDATLDTVLRFFHLEGTSFTRRRVGERDLLPGDRKVAACFERARLMSADVDPQDHHTFYQVTHEALIQYWAPLRQLAEARRADLEKLNQLERWAEDWRKGGSTDEFLLAGSRLEAALSWATSSGTRIPISPLVDEFLQRSTHTDRDISERLAEASAAVAAECAMREPDLAITAMLTVEREYTRTSTTGRVLYAALSITRLRRVVTASTQPIHEVSWAPNRNQIAIASNEDQVILYDLDANRTAAVWPVGSNGSNCVAWSPQGSSLACGNADGSVRLWDHASGVEIARWSAHDSAILDVAWSADGSRLATAGADGRVHFWDAVTGAEQACCRGHAGAAHSVAWAPDGALVASGGADRTVRIWDATDGREVNVLSGHEAAVLCVEWDPHGTRLASSSADWTVRIWVPTHPHDSLMFVAHDAPTSAVAWAGDGGRLATCGADRSLKLWSVQPYQAFATQRGHDQASTTVAWSPNDKTVATGSDDGSVRFWNTGVTLLKHGQLTRAVAWAPDGSQMASAAQDGTVKIWDMQSGAEVRTLTGHESEAVHLAWSPSGPFLASTSRDQIVRIWNTVTGDCRSMLRGHQGVGTWASWSPNGARLATASRDCTVRIWSMRTQEVVVLDFVDGATWVQWSRDGERLAVALLDRTVRVIDVATQEERTVLSGHDDDVWSAAWSSGDTKIATGCFDGKLRIWDAATGNLSLTLSETDDALQAVSWSPRHEDWIAVSSRDGTIRLWSTKASRPIFVVRGHEQPVWGLAWSPDGGRLATSSDDGEIRIWNCGFPVDAVHNLAHNMGLRELTSEERKRFLLPAAAPTSSLAGEPRRSTR